MNTYDEGALNEAARLLKQKPRSLEELAVRFNKSKRTIKRWMVELRSRNMRVVRDGVATESPYMIIDGVHRE